MENIIVLKINKENFEIVNEKQLFILCMKFMLCDRYKYSPIETLQGMANNICEILYYGYRQLFDKKIIDIKKFNAIVKKTIIFQKGLKYQNTREKILFYLYEQLLRIEGYGLLHGMGFANKFGDRLKGNSERQSMKGE